MGELKRLKRSNELLQKLNAKLVYEKHVLITKPESHEAKQIILYSKLLYEKDEIKSADEIVSEIIAEPVSKRITEITIIACMHTRRKVAEIFVESIKRVIKHNEGRFKINILVGCSDIPFNENTCAQLCDENKIPYIMAPNQPLNEKWNTTLRAAMKQWPEADYICTMGDDDIMHNNYFIEIMELIEESDRADVYGYKDIYFAKKGEKTTLRFGYSFDKLIGAGRMFRTEMLKKVGDLWVEKLNRGLDGSSENRLKQLGFSIKYFSIDEPMITDIKTGDNIQSYSGYVPHSMKVNIDFAMQNLSEQERKMFDAL